MFKVSRQTFSQSLSAQVFQCGYWAIGPDHKDPEIWLGAGRSGKSRAGQGKAALREAGEQLRVTLEGCQDGTAERSNSPQAGQPRLNSQIPREKAGCYVTYLPPQSSRYKRRHRRIVQKLEGQLPWSIQHRQNNRDPASETRQREKSDSPKLSLDLHTHIPLAWQNVAW